MVRYRVIRSVDPCGQALIGSKEMNGDYSVLVIDRFNAGWSARGRGFKEDLLGIIVGIGRIGRKQKRAGQGIDTRQQLPLLHTQLNAFIPQ